MDTLKEVIDFFTAIADIGASTRALYCFVKIIWNPDDSKIYEKRIKHVVIFAILVNCVWTFKATIMTYFIS